MALLPGIWLGSCRQTRRSLGQQPIDFGHQLQQFFGVALDRRLPAKVCPFLFIFHVHFDAVFISRLPLERDVSCGTQVRRILRR